MFGWFKKKLDTHEKETVVSESDCPQAPTYLGKITQEEAQILFEAGFKGNAHASAFYAQCAGMKDRSPPASRIIKPTR